MRIDVPQQRYEAIEELITSADSPVGIDAKKTHVLILHLLLSLDRRLQRLEQQAGIKPEGEPTTG